MKANALNDPNRSFKSKQCKEDWFDSDVGVLMYVGADGETV